MLITRADRTLVSRQVEAEVRDYFGPGVVFERSVPVSVKFREAYARGVPLIHYDRNGAGRAPTARRPRRSSTAPVPAAGSRRSAPHPTSQQ